MKGHEVEEGLQVSSILPSRQPAQVRIRFDPMGVSILVSRGTNISEAATASNIPLRLDCGGKGLCGQCRVIANPIPSFSPLTEWETDVLSPAEISQSWRLACQARVLNDAAVSIPSHVMDVGEPIDKTLLEDQYPVDPMVERITLPEAKPSRQATDVADWLARRTWAVSGRRVRLAEVEALRHLSEVGTDGQAITLIHHREKGVTAVISGVRERSLGVALDIGTTTLACYLCDLATGRVLARAASLNPQRRYGEDVISRIAFASEHFRGLQILNELIIEAINHLIRRCLQQSGANQTDVDEVTIVGNTTMESILAGFQPRSLGRSPYLPTFRSSLNLKAQEIAVKAESGCQYLCVPCGFRVCRRRYRQCHHRRCHT